MATRYVLLAEEACYLAEKSGNHLVEYLSKSFCVPGSKKEAKDQGLPFVRHFLPRPCSRYGVSPTVACVSVRNPDKIIYHVAGECPYRTYK